MPMSHEYMTTGGFSVPRSHTQISASFHDNQSLMFLEVVHLFFRRYHSPRFGHQMIFHEAILTRHLFDLNHWQCCGLYSNKEIKFQYIPGSYRLKMFRPTWILNM